MMMYNFTDLIEWLHYKDYKTTFDTLEDQKEVIVKKKLECYGLILSEPERKDGGELLIVCTSVLFYRGMTRYNKRNF